MKIKTDNIFQVIELETEASKVYNALTDAALLSRLRFGSAGRSSLFPLALAALLHVLHRLLEGRRALFNVL